VVPGVLIRFGISGGLATLTHVFVFVLFVEWLHIRPIYAAAPAFLAAVGVSYGMNYRWTFNADGPHQVMLPRFALVALAGLGLNLLITYLIVDVAQLWYGYALATIVALVPLMTYLLSRFWVFRK
jgi:putative flippase GtrA